MIGFPRRKPWRSCKLKNPEESDIVGAPAASVQRDFHARNGQLLSGIGILNDDCTAKGQWLQMLAPK